ncbi:MAG: AAA domain-containing protein [Desulfobacteraceae bacterium]|nr:AAA domain-containing protein [Desulfobacteraceae bacterium]MBC2749715.1 AAA family ATPase [Desulfobacteraceae bacterium]
MKPTQEKIPNPAEVEKEISEFLSKRFGKHVKIVTPMMVTDPNDMGPAGKKTHGTTGINFDLRPEDLIAYLDRYIVRQDNAKAVLATKICTHFNRVKRQRQSGGPTRDMVGRIKNNVLLIGPTGVGKTYIVKLIAKHIGVPFVKGDATKFSETGYVGGDVEDLVRDLVREAGDDIELAQHGIIYVDEIDKIAGSRNTIGADVSRAGVQRALLKPMEETEVDLKVPHDPVSMIQEIENFRKTGQKEKRTVNTANILFIMSGAFSELEEIVRKRVVRQGIGFGAPLKKEGPDPALLQQVKSEDLIAFGFESEFVGRLPVRTVLEPLDENDLYEILKNPSNPIIIGKKLDFDAYGIDVKFDDQALRLLARDASAENTGARGLVSAVEKALLPYETRLPSTGLRQFPVTPAVIQSPRASLDHMLAEGSAASIQQDFTRLTDQEKQSIKHYIQSNRRILSDKYSLSLTPSRLEVLAQFYVNHILDIGQVFQQIKSCYDDIKKIELEFYKRNDINVVLEEDAIDFIMEQIVNKTVTLEEIAQQLNTNFELGLKLVMEKTGQNRFFINRDALVNPESFIGGLIRNGLSTPKLPANERSED